MKLEVARQKISFLYSFQGNVNLSLYFSMRSTVQKKDSNLELKHDLLGRNCTPHTYMSSFRIKGIHGIHSTVAVDCPTSALCIVSTVDHLTVTQPSKG